MRDDDRVLPVYKESGNRERAAIRTTVRADSSVLALASVNRRRATQSLSQAVASFTPVRGNATQGKALGDANGRRARVYIPSSTFNRDLFIWLCHVGAPVREPVS